MKKTRPRAVTRKRQGKRGKFNLDSTNSISYLEGESQDIIGESAGEYEEIPLPTEPPPTPPYTLAEMCSVHADYTVSKSENLEKFKSGYFKDFQPFEKVIPLPPFPIDSIPYYIREYIKSVSVFTQTPLEMAGTLSLSVLAACISNRYIVRVRGDWFEPLCIYILVIAPPAERKSAVYNNMLFPVYHFQKQYNINNAVEFKKSDTTIRILEAKIADTEKAVSKGNGDMDELEALLREREEYKPFSPLKLTIDDSTPEKIVDIAANGNNNLLISSSEGDLIDYIASGRYDNSTSLGVYLKGHDGERVEIDRIKRGSQSVDRLLLSIALTVQPQILNGLMSDLKANGRGLCARFTYAICKGKIGEREINPPLIDEQIKANYNNLIQAILEHTVRTEGNEYLNLSPEADELRSKYHSINEKRLVNDLEDFSEWSGKAVGKMLRLAGILHVSECISNNENPADKLISVETVQNACNLTDFFIEHARAAYSQGGGMSEIEKQAQYLWKRIKSENTNSTDNTDGIKKARLLHLVQTKLDAKTITEPLNDLIERGYIRVEKIGKAEKIYINPKAL